MLRVLQNEAFVTVEWHMWSVGTHHQSCLTQWQSELIRLPLIVVDASHMVSETVAGIN